MPIIKNKRTGIEEEVSAKQLKSFRNNKALKGLFIFPETEPLKADPPEVAEAKAKAAEEKKAKAKAK